MDRLWQRLLEIYGRQFESSYGLAGGPAYETWMQGLADLSRDQLANGLRLVIEQGGEFPPNLVRFRRLCTTWTGPLDERVPKLPEPDNPKTRAVAQRHLALVREEFGLPPKPLSDTPKQRKTES